MNGVNILNTVTELPEKTGGLMILYVIFAILLSVIGGMCVWSIKEMVGDIYMNWKDWIGIGILVLIIAGCCVGNYFLIKGVFGESARRETIVYATIDDTVPWTEVNKRYELIRQDGKIYQLRVREDNDGNK